MPADVVVAAIAATPPLTGIAWAVFRELKKIGHSVNGDLSAKFDRLHVRLDDISAEVRDVKADVRDVRSAQRAHKFEHEGDGR
jgi:hypothetical protein